MSTRSNIIIKNGKTNILLYRHCDGYLQGAGQDLHDDLKSSYFVSYSGVDHKNYNIAKFTEKLLREGRSSADIELIINLVVTLSIYILLSLKIIMNMANTTTELN